MPRPIRPWHFWRAAFWQRPVFSMLVGLLFLMALPLLLSGIGPALGAARALSAGAVCGADEPPCVQPVAGILDGPFHRRGPGDGYVLRTSRADGLGVFTVASGEQDTLDDRVGTPVTAWVYDGEVVAVELTGGERVATDRLGVRGAVRQAYLAAGAGFIGLFFLAQGLARHAALGSWWSMRRTGGRPTRLAGVLFGISMGLFVLVVLGAPPLWLGAPLWVSAVTTVAGGALLGWAIRRQPKASRRQAPDP